VHGRSLTVMEFASGRVDRKGEGRGLNRPLNLFINISRGG